MRRIALAAVLLTSCQFAEDRYLTRRVSDNEAAGIWRGTEGYMQALRELGVRDHLQPREHLIVLRPDHTCVIQTHISLSSAPPQRAAYDRVNDCHWRFSTDGKHQTLNVATARGGTSLYFGEEEKKLMLWNYATDPDAWLYVEFEKIAPCNPCAN